MCAYTRAIKDFRAYRCIHAKPSVIRFGADIEWAIAQPMCAQPADAGVYT